MQLSALAAAIGLAASATLGVAQTAPASAALTLAEAMRLAEVVSPAARARQAQFAAVDGAQREAAGFLYNNPELTLDRNRNRVRQSPLPDDRYGGYSVGITQPIEIGGQPSRRREVAAAARESMRAEIDDARRQARADAALRFHAVLATQRKVRVEERSVELLDSTAQAVAKRRAAGEDTRLDANVAAVEAERARNALAVAREKLADARSELATVLQLPPTVVPDVVGELDLPAPDARPYDLEQLITSAQALPKHRAIAAREDAARARLALERASRTPDITVGLSLGRDGPGDARERITRLSLSVPLPLFKRNDAAIGQAMSEASQAEVERIGALRDTQARLRHLWSRLASQSDRLQRLERAMTPASANNQQLAAKSRQAGQIGLLDQLIVNRQALDAERDLNDALADYHATRIELEHAAGWSQEGPAR
jgi:cobalt-zinc-cadmium efflux system outer membrane protein